MTHYFYFRDSRKQTRTEQREWREVRNIKSSREEINKRKEMKRGH